MLARFRASASLAPPLCRRQFPGLSTPLSLSVLCLALYRKTPHTKTHRFAPVYLARRINASNEELRQSLLSAKRPSQGVVLTAHDADHELPNSHQTCGIDRLLVNSGAGVTYDAELLHRLLKGIAADADDPEEYFDTDIGELKLTCVAEPKTFKGKQKNVIAMFWKARQQHSLKWSDVTTKTSCGKDPGSVFGPDGSIWLERIEGQRGHYRLRTRQ